MSNEEKTTAPIPDNPSDGRLPEAVIFGAGSNGSVAFHLLKNKGIRTRFFCDNNIGKQGTVLHGVPVVGPSELEKIDPDIEIFVASIYFKNIAAQLSEAGIHRWRDCLDLFASPDIEKLELELPAETIARNLSLYRYAVLDWKSESSLLIKNLDVVVTEKCSLRCRDCANLMQYYRNPKECEKEALFTALDRFMSAIDRLLEFRILGGEPLLAKELPAVVAKLNSYGNYERIRLLTNGTILPKPDVVESLKNGNVVVDITDYGRLSVKIDGLIDCLEKNGISHVITKAGNWQDCGKIKRYERTPDELRNLFADCCAHDVLTVLHGRLYLCPFSAHAENLGAIPRFESDGIDLLEKTVPEALRKRLFSYYKRTDAICACDYCPGRSFDAKPIPAAVQTKHPLPYEIQRETR